MLPDLLKETTSSKSGGKEILASELLMDSPLAPTKTLLVKVLPTS
jgi:hypothetical protein